MQLFIVAQTIEKVGAEDIPQRHFSTLSLNFMNWMIKRFFPKTVVDFRLFLAAIFASFFRFTHAKVNPGFPNILCISESMLFFGCAKEPLYGFFSQTKNLFVSQCASDVFRLFHIFFPYMAGNDLYSFYHSVSKAYAKTCLCSPLRNHPIFGTLILHFFQYFREYLFKKN